jgi:hypothetical protein
MFIYCPFYGFRQVAYDYKPPQAAAIIKGGTLAPDQSATWQSLIIGC